MKDQLFSDARRITRKTDELHAHYSTGEIVMRIWREHFRPRIGLLLVAGLAMIITGMIITASSHCMIMHDHHRMHRLTKWVGCGLRENAAFIVPDV